jgi:hypothetical protein
MDQSAQKRAGVILDKRVLPVDQLDCALVFLARTVLREEARPLLRAVGEPGARPAKTKVKSDAPVRHHGLDRVPAFADDAGIP